MENLQINIAISPELYIKDPESSELGQRIISNSIEMIDELGFEAFTFKKLGIVIGSNESSIYRYFDSKYMLLVYLLCWYWSWIEYKLVFTTAAMSSPLKKLKAAVQLLTRKVIVDNSFSNINEVTLHRIIIAESTKAYHTKDVDENNKKGYFKIYKRVVQRVSEMVLENNPSFQYPHMLISTIIEGAHQQRYFSEHLPALTDHKNEEDSIVKFYTTLAINTIHL